MNREFDKIVENGLNQNVTKLPESYENKVKETLSHLPAKKKRNNFMKYAVAAVVITMLGSTGTYAAVKYHDFQQRKAAMTQQEKQELNDKTQQETAEADSYSRELTSKEDKRMRDLRMDYRCNKVFPKKEITVVDKKSEVEKGKMTYCHENSTFYISEKELSDEELLEIIDYGERVNYALNEINLK